MKVLSPMRMAKYDEYAIQTWGIPAAVLMENAGRSTYRLMKEKYLGDRRRMAVVCGRGNNGGDGFVVARYALRDGLETKAYLLCRSDQLRGDAALNRHLYAAIGGEITECVDSVEALHAGMRDADIVVDAVFGTGLSRPVEGREKLAIEAINQSGKCVIAIDIPSGIDGSTGALLGTAVKATHTFTYGYPKLGQILYPGAFHAGRLTVVDISLPAAAEEILGIDGHIIDGEMVSGFLKGRVPWSHKGTFGHAAVIAGSKGKTGAAHMTSLAALKVGAGLVTLVIPESLNAIMEVKLTEAMTYPVADEGAGCFKLSSYGRIMEFIEDKDVVIMGPGLSRESETMDLVRRIYRDSLKPFVIDADGINAFQGHLDAIKHGAKEAILTPHPGELARLLGITPKDVNADRIGVGKKFVEKTGVNLVLKGARTMVFTRDGELFICPTGNPALAKGGSGDILTGFIGGFASQGLSLWTAGFLGVYLHGYIADRWAENSTDMDLLACDLLSGVGDAVRDIRDGKERIYIEKSL